MYNEVHKMENKILMRKIHKEAFNCFRKTNELDKRKVIKWGVFKDENKRGGVTQYIICTDLSPPCETGWGWGSARGEAVKIRAH